MESLYVSPYTLEFRVRETLYLFNQLSGAVDRLSDKAVQQEWRLLKSFGRCSPTLSEVLRSRGYVWRDRQEEEVLIERLRRASDQQASRIMRCHVILTYDCNLQCAYCYEEGILREREVVGRERLKAMMGVIEHLALETRSEKARIVLFGGEPLLKRPRQVTRIQQVLEHATRNGWDIEVVTNGVDLDYFVPILAEHKISQIQVTLDGPKDIHDGRRPRVDGAGSFEAVVRSIDSALASQLPIAVRVNADTQNVEHIAELVNHFAARGWLDESRFGAYWGLTFDLHDRHPYCATSHVMLKRILDIRRKHPLTKRVSLEAWEALQFLLYPFLLKEPRLPKFFFCGAQRNEWCFDLYGDVYFCADGVGREEFKTGRYDPTFELDHQRARFWRQPETSQAPGCAQCRVRLCCGGGCWFRRACTSRYPPATCCTEHVWPLLAVTMKYLHRSPEVFEVARKTPERRPAL